MRVSFAGRVAIVTGAGNGLGRAYALALAKLGARVVVNDLAPGPADADAGSGAAAVAEEIVAQGGTAMAAVCSVTDETAVGEMVDRTMAHWGRIDILINNAGILLPRNFGRVDIADFRKVVEVNLMGSAICAHAVWSAMGEAGYGRILMTTSEGALYPVPGAASYAAAKLGVVGLMNSLSAEGQRHGIHVNSIAPAAATRMTRAILSAADFARLGVEPAVAAALFLVGDDAPTGVTLAAGGGRFERAYITHTAGVEIGGDGLSAGAVAERFAEISARRGDEAPEGQHSVAQVGEP